MTRVYETNAAGPPAFDAAQPPTFDAPYLPAFDMAKTGAFMSKIMGDMSGAVACIMCTLGDRLGLFKELAAAGPSTPAELAGRAGIRERYAREWLSAMACAGYLEYDPAGGRFTLPPEYAPVLAQESGPMFMGGVYQHLPGLFGILDLLSDAFRHGGGVRQDAYGEDFREGMERISAGWFDNLLVPQWVPAAQGVQAKLERGARVADIGCGSGRAIIKLAQAFPNSQFVGYDVFGPAVERAAANAEAAGVNDRVRFVRHDAVEGLPEQFDLITTFDVIHDIVNPVAVLRGIRQALAPDGTYLLLEINCADRLEENAGPVGAILYGTSVLYCTPTSIANGGEGLGTMGMPESRVRAFCAEAGFGSVRRLPIEHPFNILYEVKA